MILVGWMDGWMASASAATDAVLNDWTCQPILICLGYFVLVGLLTAAEACDFCCWWRLLLLAVDLVLKRSMVCWHWCSDAFWQGITLHPKSFLNSVKFPSLFLIFILNNKIKFKNKKYIQITFVANKKQLKEEYKKWSYHERKKSLQKCHTSLEMINSNGIASLVFLPKSGRTEGRRNTYVCSYVRVVVSHRGGRQITLRQQRDTRPH